MVAQTNFESNGQLRKRIYGSGVLALTTRPSGDWSVNVRSKDLLTTSKFRAKHDNKGSMSNQNFIN